MRIIITTDDGEVLVTENIDEEDDETEEVVYAVGGTAALEGRRILIARKTKRGNS